jgi:hypothetical protein
VRTIYLVSQRARYAGGATVAFSHRRAAERYAERVVKDKWKEATDFERIGQNRLTRIERLRERGHDDGSYEMRMEKEALRNEMEQARTLKDRGYAEFRRQYEYNYGDQPTVSELTLYRTYADFTSQ